MDGTLSGKKTELGTEHQPDEFQPGDLFAQQYRILEKGRKGGMGVVYKCRDEKLHIDCALKIIHPRLIQSQEAVSRFRQEVAISLRLTHKNIVRVFNLGEHEGIEFFTMEWVEGRNLRELLNERKEKGLPFSLAEARTIISQLSEALQEAHKFTVHRDIKPENLLIETGERDSDLTSIVIKLTDFGIAKMLTPSRCMSTSLQMGTPYYMAPEQKLDAAHVDQRADIYAVGVILFELLTLENTIGLEMPSEINQNLPREIDNVIKKALATKAENRYGDIKELDFAVNKVIETKGKREVAGENRTQEAEEERRKAEARKQEEKRIAEEKARKEEELKGQNTEYTTQKAEEKKLDGEGKFFNGKVLGGIIAAVLLVVLIVVFKGKPKEEVPPPPLAAEQKAPEAVPAPAPASAPLPVSEKPAQPPQQSSDDQKVREEKGKKFLAMARKAFKKNDLTEARKYIDEAKALISDSKDLLAFEKQLEKAEKKVSSSVPATVINATPASAPVQTGPKEIARDGRFIAYNNGIVLDTRTNLMWATKDNGSNINWSDARKYCDNYPGGGYTDWRMPTLDELAGLYYAAKSQKVECGGEAHITTNLIQISCYYVWASESRDSGAADFSFDVGGRHWDRQSYARDIRALPVRSGK